MTAQIFHLPRRKATPQAATRSLLNEATFRDLGGGMVALTVPCAVVERLYEAATEGGEQS